MLTKKVKTKTFLPFLILIAVAFANISSIAQTVTYTASTEDFMNPDRGFYYPISTYSSNFVPLVANDLISRRTTAFTPWQGNYTVRTSLIFRYYVLDSFTGTDNISSSFLNSLQADFNTARQAGVRLIIRFTYNIDPDNSCGQAACSPYGDVDKTRILAHISDIKPTLQGNSDVLAAVQMGFIGVWGEQYYTDYFGDPSSAGDGKITNANWQKRNDVLEALLDAVPSNRMVQVRYPQLKQKYVYGINASVNSAALTNTEAHLATDKARIGLHNDCFLASPDDYGTYWDYGSDAASPSNQTSILKPYAGADGKFTAIGGETCGDADFDPQNNCTGQAVTDMAALHYSYLNSDYNNGDVNNDWVTGGCMDEIKRKLGYRFVLKDGTYPATAFLGETVNFTLNVENIGFAAPFNERILMLVFRHIASGDLHKIAVNGSNIDTRFWHTGNITVGGNVNLPSNLAEGNYELLLHILDPSDNNRIADRPEYSIRLANQNMWESTTGFNDLNHVIAISPNPITCDCSETDLILTDPVSINKDFSTNGKIESTQVITGAITVNYSAVENILLKSGHSVANGVSFRAYIDNCSTNSSSSIPPLKTSPSISNQKDYLRTTNKLALLPTIEAFPNPFQNELEVTFELQQARTTSLTLYDSFGRIVDVPLQPNWKEAGIYHYKIIDKVLPKGLYFIVLKTGNQSITKKIIAK